MNEPSVSVVQYWLESVYFFSMDVLILSGSHFVANGSMKRAQLFLFTPQNGVNLILTTLTDHGGPPLFTKGHFLRNAICHALNGKHEYVTEGVTSRGTKKRRKNMPCMNCNACQSPQKLCIFPGQGAYFRGNACRRV